MTDAWSEDARAKVNELIKSAPLGLCARCLTDQQKQAVAVALTQVGGDSVCHEHAIEAMRERERKAQTLNSPIPKLPRT